jgi:transcriptional regulator with PAS, ATPase and Fis domain
MDFLLILSKSEEQFLSVSSTLHNHYDLSYLEAGDPVDTIIHGGEPVAILYFSSFDSQHETHLKTLRQTYPQLPLFYIHDSLIRISKRNILEPLVDVFLPDTPPSSLFLEILQKQIERSQTLGRSSITPLVEDLNRNQDASPVMQKIMKMAKKVAPTDATILITGESGTGKEVLSRWIHANSTRKQRPFVAINCGALTETLLESELFGYKKGAFTGAERDEQGLFEAAHHGTLFLDEVGEMPLSLQVRLLRVLQERRIRRVGDVEDIPVDVRIIGATNKDLKELVKKEMFREDLFYRFHVVPIHLPPLRERRETLPKLIEEFFFRLAREYKKSVSKISPAAINILMNYAYPGNIRELQNVLEYAVIMCESNTIQPQDLPADMRFDTPMNLLPGPSISEVSSLETMHEFLSYRYKIDAPTLEKVERILILERMQMYRENQKQVATSLGISRTSLWRKLKEYKPENNQDS